MKKLQQILVSIVLTLLFSTAVFAGDGIIGTGKTEPAPTPVPVMTTTSDAEAEGIIGTGKSVSVDPVTEVALSMLQTVLSLF
jgi:hypothetical protein